MVIKVYLSLISCSQEVKKNQQRAVMILESKNIPFNTIDITDPGQEEAKDYMNENAKPRGENKVPMTPQIFNEAEYCGDFEELDMSNETDALGEFLKLTDEEKKGIKIGITGILPAKNSIANDDGPTPDTVANPASDDHTADSIANSNQEENEEKPQVESTEKIGEEIDSTPEVNEA